MNNDLGIFGDSSAALNKDFEHSWVTLLSQDQKFDNYAAEGASLVYVYDQLIKHGKNYKKCIIFIPPVGRLWMPDFNRQHFVNHRTVDLLNRSSFLDQKILSSIKDYFINIWNYKREKLIQCALVDSIRLRYPTALIIPVTPDSVYDDPKCMHHISLLDNEFYNVHEHERDWGRACHMNRENNKIFFQKIVHWIKTDNFDLDVKDFKYPVELKTELFR